MPGGLLPHRCCGPIGRFSLRQITWAGPGRGAVSLRCGFHASGRSVRRTVGRGRACTQHGQAGEAYGSRSSRARWRSSAYGHVVPLHRCRVATRALRGSAHDLGWSHTTLRRSRRHRTPTRPDGVVACPVRTTRAPGPSWTRHGRHLQSSLGQRREMLPDQSPGAAALPPPRQAPPAPARGRPEAPPPRASATFSRPSSTAPIGGAHNLRTRQESTAHPVCPSNADSTPNLRVGYRSGWSDGCGVGTASAVSAGVPVVRGCLPAAVKRSGHLWIRPGAALRPDGTAIPGSHLPCQPYGISRILKYGGPSISWPIFSTSRRSASPSRGPSRTVRV